MPGSAPYAAEPPQEPEPPAHGVDLGADPLEGEGLPGREDVDRAVRAEAAPCRIVSNTEGSRSWANWSAAAVPVGVTTRTGRRVPRRRSPASTNAWAGVVTARVVAAGTDHAGHGRFVAEQRGEGAERHAVRVPAAVEPECRPRFRSRAWSR